LDLFQSEGYDAIMSVGQMILETQESRSCMTPVAGLSWAGTPCTNTGMLSTSSSPPVFTVTTWVSPTPTTTITVIIATTIPPPPSPTLSTYCIYDGGGPPIACVTLTETNT